MDTHQLPPLPPSALDAPTEGQRLRTYGRQSARSRLKRSLSTATHDLDHDPDHVSHHKENDHNHIDQLDPAARLSLRRALLGIPSSPPSPVPSAPVTRAASNDHKATLSHPAQKRKRTGAGAPASGPTRKGPLDAFFIAKKPSPSPTTLPPPTSPPPFASSSSAPSASPPKRLIQTRLNFGQRNQGATRCPDCGMHYLPSLESDRKLHAKFHKASQAGIEYPGYRADTLLATHPTFRILYHDPFPSPTSTKPVHSKLTHIHAHVDAALGAAPTDPTTTCTYLAIGGGARVVGVLVMDAQQVAAWRVAHPDAPVDLARADSPGVWGVSRIWVDPRHTRQGVATHLLAAMAHRLGVEPRADNVAFSQPTEAGWALAKAWVGKDEVLVYY